MVYVACCGLGVVLSSRKTHTSDIDSWPQFFIDGSRTYSLEERKEKYFQSVGGGNFPQVGTHLSKKFGNGTLFLL